MRTVLFGLAALSLAASPALADNFQVLQSKSHPAMLGGAIKEGATVRVVAPSSQVAALRNRMATAVMATSPTLKFSTSTGGKAGSGLITLKVKVSGAGAQKALPGLVQQIAETDAAYQKNLDAARAAQQQKKAAEAERIRQREERYRQESIQRGEGDRAGGDIG